MHGRHCRPVWKLSGGQGVPQILTLHGELPSLLISAVPVEIFTGHSLAPGELRVPCGRRGQHPYVWASTPTHSASRVVSNQRFSKAQSGDESVELGWAVGVGARVGGQRWGRGGGLGPTHGSTVTNEPARQ